MNPTNVIDTVTGLATNAANVATNAVPQETLNSLMVDMLRGVRDFGGQAANVTKDAIGKSVDFVMTQTPLLVQEFLTWRFAEALISTIFALLIIGICGYIFHRLFKFFKKVASDDTEEIWVFGWIPLAILAVIIFTTGAKIPDHVMTMTKIKVAPRVYLVEFAADQYKTVNNTPTRGKK